MPDSNVETEMKIIDFEASISEVRIWKRGSGLKSAGRCVFIF